jgi:DNA-binding response OmpR family regulator
MSDSTDSNDQDVASVGGEPTGIQPVDVRTDGLETGGSYLIVGTPGPAKMVATFHFLAAGLSLGEPALLLTNGDDEGTLGVARAWGFDFERPWRDGLLRLLGFKDDFELRAIRTVEPEEVLEELDALAGPDVARIAVDPGSMFLSGGARSLLGSSFLKWARNHPATVCSTFSVDGAAASLPSSADWLVHATTGRLVIEWRTEDIYQLTLVKAVPDARAEPISVQLKPGAGLVAPGALPARRGRDRPGVDASRLLLISLGGEHAADIETWARDSFTSDIVSEPFDAVARVQEDSSFGGVLVHAPRSRVQEAVKACKAIRPLTRAAIVFASDDAVRSTDRISVLEAGADDCLSGGIDFRELDLRLKQAIAAGSRPGPRTDGGGRSERPVGAGGAELPGGRMARDLFVQELERRADDPVLKFFCILDVTSKSVDARQLEDILTEQVRADEGDMVSADSDHCAVLLQGAREGQLGPFLGRLRARAEGKADTPLAVEVLSHPADADRIGMLLGIASGAPD